MNKIAIANARSLPEEFVFTDTFYDRPNPRKRRAVLRETVEHIANNYESLHLQARQNLETWREASNAQGSPQKTIIEIYPNDWGVVTQKLTKKWGICFAALNMANAWVPGGGYLEGSTAQEENMFRRTDCHFSISKEQLTESLLHYKSQWIDLLNAKDGLVYLDKKYPRVCVRGPEDFNKDNLGYEWLSPENIFPFYELRAAAVNLNSGEPFDPIECLRRIRAQLDTLKNAEIKHVVLGAHGCGAFRNPAEKVAKLYAQAIEEYDGYFDVIAFAVFHAGYGPDNYTPFVKEFDGNHLENL